MAESTSIEACNERAWTKFLATRYAAADDDFEKALTLDWGSDFRNPKERAPAAPGTL